METVIFRLLDKKVDKNSFFLNADGTKDLERKLDFTNSYGILNPFYIVETDGVRKYFRYIAGCAIFDPAEQDKQKIVANQQNSTIEFKAGVDIVLDKKLGGVLIRFLEMHPWNTTGPNHTKDHEDVFFKYDPKAEELKEFKEATEEDRAYEMLIDLARNKDRMRAIAALFSETATLGSDEAIYLGLRALARSKPLLFNSSIGNRENTVLSDVMLCQRINVIARDLKGWFYVGDQTQIMACITRSQKDAEAELVHYLISKEGEVFYQQMLIKKQQMEVELNAPAGLTPEDTGTVNEAGLVTPPVKKGKQN